MIYCSTYIGDLADPAFHWDGGDWDRRHDFERYVSHELAPYTVLWPSRELVARSYFGTGIPHPRLHERVGDYTLIMKDNFVIKDWLFAEHRYSQVGVHGGLSEQELYVPLIIASC